MAEEKDEFEEEEIEDEYPDDLNYKFYAPHLLYNLIKTYSYQLGLDTVEKKPRSTKIKKWKISEKEPKHGLLGTTRHKYKEQFAKRYNDPNDETQPPDGATVIKNLNTLREVIKEKAKDLYKLIKGKEITLKHDKIPYTITIKNTDDFNKLISSPIDALNIVDRKNRKNRKEIHVLKKEIGKREDENEDLKKQLEELNINSKKEIEDLNGKIDSAKDVIKQENKKYKEYVEKQNKMLREIRKDIENMRENSQGYIKKIYTVEEADNIIKANTEKLNGYKDKNSEAYKQLLGETEYIQHLKELITKKNKYENDADKITKDKDAIIEKNNKIIEENKKRINELKDAVAYKTKQWHEAEVKVKHTRDELKDKEEQPKPTYQPSNTPPTLKDYIKDKVINKSYSLEKDELIKVIEKDIDEHKLPKDIDVSKLADTIYLQGAKYINKHMEKIKSLVKLTGYDNDLYNKLPSELAGEIQKYIHDKALEDIRKKNIRYILPKEMPRWEKAVNKGINPMLGRGAWSK